jgi:hypothetical protein
MNSWLCQGPQVYANVSKPKVATNYLLVHNRLLSVPAIAERRAEDEMGCGPCHEDR